MTPQREPVTAEDLLLAAQICHDALMPAIDRDWSVPAGDLAWSCQTTLDHLPNALLSYANHLATRRRSGGCRSAMATRTARRPSC